MLGENLFTLRNLRKMSQDDMAKIVGISRQCYSKWETGESIPDIEKCDIIAKYFDVSLDALMHQDASVGLTRLAPAPLGKYLYGTIKVRTDGSILLPKVCRKMFGLNEGVTLVCVGDANLGVGLVKTEMFEKRMKEAFEQSKIILYE